MKKQKKLLVGNWKMNPPSIAEAKKIAGDVKRGIKKISKTNVVLCPPAVFLGSLQSFPTNSLFLGAQDAFYEPLGAYTGEISYTQLADFKVSHVIVGHSERRARGETDDVVSKKVRTIIGEGMTAVLCIGEEVRDKEGNYLASIKNQLAHDLRDVSKKSLDRIVIAYEPVWAIGAKYAMTSRDVHETSIYIKKVLHDLYGTLAQSVPILYGGAVDDMNAAELVKGGNVSGLLVGRASLRPADFLSIIRSIEEL